MPNYHYEDFDDFLTHPPNNTMILGVEKSEKSELLPTLKHHKSSVYLLGGRRPRFIKKGNRKESFFGKISISTEFKCCC